MAKISNGFIKTEANCWINIDKIRYLTVNDETDANDDSICALSAIFDDGTIFNISMGTKKEMIALLEEIFP